MAAAIDHPNILPIHEAGEIEGVLFIAMRYVEGERPRAAPRTRSPRRRRAAIAILAQVAAALDAAHARGLVHRDVKPANILLDPQAGPDGTDHAYLTDFGLTKRGGSEGQPDGRRRLRRAPSPTSPPSRSRAGEVDRPGRRVLPRLRGLRVPDRPATLRA